MKNIFKKENILTILLAFLLIAASSYILWDVFSKTKERHIRHGYILAVSEIMKEAEKEGCEPFSIFQDEKEIFLINIECLEPRD